MSREIYFIDDDRSIRTVLQRTLKFKPFKIRCFEAGKDMLKLLRRNWPGIIITDINMPEMDGFELLARVKEIDPEIPVIILTGNADMDTVLQALRAGAYDFLEKPVSVDYLLESANRAYEKRRLHLENRQLRSHLRQDRSNINFIGKSKIIEELRKKILTVADSPANVLIQGETGSGKEVIARMLHSNSNRNDAPFVAINCGAISETLMDSELFGHEQGAFTGAHKKRVGKIEFANGGTLFLDEVNSMPLPMQVKLLRVLEERKLERLGSNEGIDVDVRIIAATQEDLKSLAQKGEFREDLFYRLNVIPLKVPPLRERREDIPALFNSFLVEFCAKYDRPISPPSPQLLRILTEAEWEGNVRELYNAAERFVLMGEIDAADSQTPEAEVRNFRDPGFGPLPERIGNIEKTLISEELTRNKGSIEKTCQGLSLPRKTLYDKMKKYGISRKDFVPVKG